MWAGCPLSMKMGCFKSDFWGADIKKKLAILLDQKRPEDRKRSHDLRMGKSQTNKQTNFFLLADQREQTNCELLEIKQGRLSYKKKPDPLLTVINPIFFIFPHNYALKNKSQGVEIYYY